MEPAEQPTTNELLAFYHPISERACEVQCWTLLSRPCQQAGNRTPFFAHDSDQDR